MITAAPFFEGAGRPSKPYWGPQQGRRVILWESLSLESQQECLMELQNDAEWVIWCKAKPKDKATQTFREYGKCIFEGKRAKVTQDNDNQEGSLGGKHVTGRRCMLQLQEAENWHKPAATTWAAEFLLREGESRECLGSWLMITLLIIIQKLRKDEPSR